MTLLEQIMSIPNINYASIGISVYTKNMATYCPEYRSSEINMVHIHGLTGDKYSQEVIEKMFKLGFRVSATFSNFIEFKKL